MSRFRMGLAVVAMTVTALAVPGAFTTGGGVANAAPIPGGSITTVCTGTTVGTTFTLTADCGEVTTSLTVPAAITTVDGAGHTISATDLNGANPAVHTPIPQFNGGIVTNATPGQTMNIRNVTITGPANGFSLCGPQDPGANAVLYGIFFNGAAGGSVSNVTIDHIFQFQNFAFGSCQTGRAIRAENSGTLTITNTTVRDYQKSGFEARGTTIMNVSGSTAGPPHPLNGFSAQNAVSIVGASATIANNTIIGSGDQGPGLGRGNGTGVLLFGAHDVTVDHNTITGLDTNIGVSVTDSNGNGTGTGSTNITISFNAIGRTGADAPPDPGRGVDVGHPRSSATLICNTFSGWITNIVGAVQISCTPLPNGTECTTYSADTLSVAGGTAPFTWSVSAGTLPPGLTLAPSTGAITGTPTAAGTYNFTVTVVDSTVPTLTATQAQTITIAPGCATPPTTPTTPTPPTPTPTPPTPAPQQSTVQVVKTWVGTPSTTTIFVDANGQAPYDASVVANANGATTSFTYPVSTSVTVGETPVPTGYTATIDCGQGAQTYSAPITVNAPATAGATLVCTIVNTANPAPPPPPRPTPAPRPQRPVLVIEKVANKHVVRGGKTAQFTITVRARGQGTATNVQVCDVVPEGLVFVRAPGARFQNGQACWRIAQLSRRRTMTFRVTVRATRVLQRTIATNVATLRPCSPRSTASAGAASRCNDRARVVILPPISRVKGGGVTG